MDGKEIPAILRYIDERLPEPSPDWSAFYFEERSYFRWAAGEILERIMAEELRFPPHLTGLESAAPSDIAEEFMNQMNYFSEISPDPEKRFIFSCARDCAREILELIGVKEERYEL